MPTETEIEAKFWKALKSDRTVMLGLDGARDGHVVPMTAQTDDDEGGPIWFFTSKDNGIVQTMGQSHRAVFAFASKGHDVFATVHGDLVPDNDRATIDRLWNPFVAAWYEGGKDDPGLQLIRLDAEKAEIWLDGNSMIAGIKMLFGVNPQADYKDKVAEVTL